jgi:hypothetical protein
VKDNEFGICLNLFPSKHASWLSMAEIELHVLTEQCLNRRIDEIEIMKLEAT